MCGRFSATFSFREIKLRWNLQGDFSFESEECLVGLLACRLVFSNLLDSLL
jgi:hypothetical protein